MSYTEFILYGCLCVTLLIFSRIVLMLVLYNGIRRRSVVKKLHSDKVHTLIVLGSGGHTSEMMLLVETLQTQRYSPRIYVIASTDSWSELKAYEFENKLEKHDSNFEVVKIPRSRSVHQSYLSSIATTLYSTLILIPIMFRYNPELVLCNGPGTCVPVCVIAFLMKCCYISNNTIVFVESICRVKSLSLSGKILQYFVDEILVQWPELLMKCRRAKYLGRVL